MFKQLSNKVKQTWINYRYQRHLQRSRFQPQLEDLPQGFSNIGNNAHHKNFMASHGMPFFLSVQPRA